MVRLVFVAVVIVHFVVVVWKQKQTLTGILVPNLDPLQQQQQQVVQQWVVVSMVQVVGLFDKWSLGCPLGDLVPNQVPLWVVMVFVAVPVHFPMRRMKS